MEADITEEEVRKLLGRMKQGRAAGHDGITVEMLRAGGAPVVSFLTDLFNVFLRSQVLPTDFNLGLLVPLLKPGKKSGHEGSFRPVMLLSVIRKLFAAVVLDRVKPILYGEIRERQAGFRAGRSTADGVFFMRMMCERACLGE